MAVKFVVNFCSVCGLILLSSSRISGIEPTSEMVRRWADRIGKEASEFTEDLTGAKDLKQAYENLTFSTEDVDWSEVLNRMKTEMEAFFSSKTSSLKKLVDQAEDAYCKYTYNKNLKLSDIDYPNAKDLDQYLNKSGLRLEYNSTFQSEISFNRSVIHVPTDVYDGAAEIVNGIRWTSALDSVFDKNRHDDPSLSWQYFGSDKGFMRTYPAKHWDSGLSQVDLFDARRRPWFIQGATSPKNIVILIDASGSMHGVPMRIAKLSAQNLIDTFGDNDFFNVVYFNKDAYVLCCSDTGPTLLQATKKNKIYVKSKLQDIIDGDVAVWKHGMTKAFELLKKANKCAQCQQAIMVLSDGTTSSLSDLFKEHNPDKKVRVFTFAVGPPAESTQALRQMACNNRGYFSRIQSVGAVREVSEDYIRVLTRPMAMAPKENATDHTVWTSVYLDALGLGMMVTGTLPVFHRIKGSSNCGSKGGMQQEEKTKDHFLGVMGTDVPLDYLREFMLQPLVGPSGSMFAVNNNGMIIFHPRVKTVYGYLLDPPGVDLTDVELTENHTKILELKKAMIDTVPITAAPRGSGPNSQSFEVYDVSVDELRVVKRTMNYYFDGLEGTSFSLGMSTPRLGYKYKLTGYTDADVITELHDQLSKENSKNIAVEMWPYCRNVALAETSPLEQLINGTKAGDTKLCNNVDLLSGLLVDLNVTSDMPTFWSSKSTVGIKEMFVRTFWGLTRSLSFLDNKLGSSSQGNYFGRVFGSQIPNTSIIYTTPYLAAKSDKNTSSVFAYKRTFWNQRPVAVLGYEMDMHSFTTELLVKKTQCQPNGPECNSCDRTGKNSYEGFYCYLLDENGFVVAANDETSAGKFFGRVDAPVMKTLIRSEDENSGAGVYNKVVLTDFQAVCEEKSGVNSRGTSFLLRPLLSISAYTEWWTTKAVWSLLYFNLYSWIFSESRAAADAVEDVAKNISCIKNMTTYYSTKEDVLENGTTDCGGCSRSHVVASVPNSNLYLVVVQACGQCSDSVKGMGIPGEPREISRETVENACKEPGYRKRPKRCFMSTHPETGYMCGVGSFARPSFQVVAVQLWFIVVLWKIIGFL